MPRLAVVTVLAACLALTACAPAPDATPPVSSAPAAPAPPPVTSPSPVTAPSPAALAPASVSLPAIDLAEPLIDLGIAAKGDMEVPADFDEVGWFTGGGRPGGRGPLVIAGHVDSPNGPAVFVRLREVAVGDEVEVTDTAGALFRYTVTEVADYPKSAFPTARVFGATVTDELRLITCGGVFDRASASYTENRVVYAERSDEPR